MYARPVICIDFRYQFFVVLGQVGAGIIKIVSVYVEGSPYAFRVLLASVIPVRLEDAVDNAFLRTGGRSRLVIVVDEIVRASFARIASVGRSPIIEYVIPQVDLLLIGIARGAASRKAGRTAAMVCQQVMVERGRFSSPDASVPMPSFAMLGERKAFADDAPL